MTNFNLADAFCAVALRHADRTAISTPDVSRTFGDLLRLGSQCARHIEAHGVGRGDRVAIALPKADDTVIAVLACWLAGATSMVVDFRTKRQEKAILASTFAMRAIIEPHAAPQAQDYLSIAAGESLADTVASGDDTLRSRPSEDHPAIIIRTSGTTGSPMGIVFGHGTFFRLHWSLSRFHFGPEPGLFVHALPMYYMAGIARTFSRLFDASPVHVLPAMSSALEIAEAIQSLDARHTIVVPPQMQGLLELAASRDGPMFPQLATLAGSGGTIPADTVVRAYNELSNNLMITYGASFGGNICVASGPDILRKPGSVGRPLPHNHVRILDSDGNEAAPGQSGLICVRGTTVADAVIGETRLHSDRMIDGWAVPGDLGVLDEEGFLTLTGRATDMIIRKGVNVYPREIEAIFERHDDVIEAAAVGFRHPDAGEEIAVFIVARPGTRSETMAEHAQANIVADKRPREIRVVDKLPRNEAGKVLKQVLTDMIEAETASDPAR